MTTEKNRKSKRQITEADVTEWKRMRARGLRLREIAKIADRNIQVVTKYLTAGSLAAARAQFRDEARLATLRKKQAAQPAQVDIEDVLAIEPVTDPMSKIDRYLPLSAMPSAPVDDALTAGELRDLIRSVVAEAIQAEFARIWAPRGVAAE